MTSPLLTTSPHHRLTSSLPVHVEGESERITSNYTTTSLPHLLTTPPHHHITFSPPLLITTSHRHYLTTSPLAPSHNFTTSHPHTLNHPHTLTHPPHTPSHTLTHPHSPSHTLTHPQSPSITLNHPHSPSITRTHPHSPLFGQVQMEQRARAACEQRKSERAILFHHDIRR